MNKCLLIILFSCQIFAETNFKKDKDSSSVNDRSKKCLIDLSSVKDTLYTLGDYFIEVNLSDQMAYLHSRFGQIKSFGISSGTLKLEDGVETKEGLFTIQFKVKEWYSTQFDSTLMLNFMTFNWGIGFHSLQGNSYYQYLGKKKSSHGCLRVSREDAQNLFNKIQYGTPVLVHKGNSAVYVGFADRLDSQLKYYSYNELLLLIPKRLEKLYKGKYLLSYREKLLIDNYNVQHPGLPIGDKKKIALRQILKPDYLFVENSTPKPKSFFFYQLKIKSTFEMNLCNSKVSDVNTFLVDILEN